MAFGSNSIEVGISGVKPVLTGAWVRTIVETALAHEGKSGKRVSVLLTNNSRIRKINKKYLGHDYATDVISFGVNPKQMASTESGYLGDIVVSVETAGRVSRELGISLKEELARYLVHGTLHLVGYRDGNGKDRRLMEKRQEFILSNLSLKPGPSP